MMAPFRSVRPALRRLLLHPWCRSDVEGVGVPHRRDLVSSSSWTSGSASNSATSGQIVEREVVEADVGRRPIAEHTDLAPEQLQSLVRGRMATRSYSLIGDPLQPVHDPGPRDHDRPGRNSPRVLLLLSPNCLKFRNARRDHLAIELQPGS
jgi:hypothetical protein